MTGRAAAAGAALGAVAGAIVARRSRQHSAALAGAALGVVVGAIVGAMGERALHLGEEHRRMDARAMHPDEGRRRASAFAEREAVDLQDAPGLPGGPAQAAYGGASIPSEGERTLELREEQLAAHKDVREVGEALIRTQVEELPGQLEVEAYREEVEVEHVPVGQVVQERVAPWEEDGVLVVPVYEEQLVVVKRLVLREQLRIRRMDTTETRLIEDTLRRDLLVIEDPNDTGLVREQFATAREYGEPSVEGARGEEDASGREGGGFLGNLVRKALE